LALASAISLGLSRFSYALLLPPMRSDLGWSYLTAGTMNTVNATGYLIGALLMPFALKRFDARWVMLGGSAASGALLVAHGLVMSDTLLYVLRMLTGAANAACFVGGGLLAARLGTSTPSAVNTPDAGVTSVTGVAGVTNAAGVEHVAATAAREAASRRAPSAGLVLGIYYGGTGVGIVLSALLVPPLAAGSGVHPWQSAWLALGAAALFGTLLIALGTSGLTVAAGRGSAGSRPVDWSRFACGLASYFLFGLGYIGYMTFVVTLLREQQMNTADVATFFGLLGVAVMASPWIWAALLQRHRGGGAMRLLNALLAIATLLPVLSARPSVVFASGLLFGGVLLSVVASTTALVRHNLAPAEWSAGISAFTIVFAAGQIVGPTLVGLVADGAGGLRGGLAGSAGILLLGALIATWQRPLKPHHV
jgi:predicted MFS family arabinose efflux permease